MKEDGEEKEAMKDTLINQTIPYYLDRFNSTAESGYMALGRVSVDLLLFLNNRHQICFC